MALHAVSESAELFRGMLAGLHVWLKLKWPWQAEAHLNPTQTNGTRSTNHVPRMLRNFDDSWSQLSSPAQRSWNGTQKGQGLRSDPG